MLKFKGAQDNDVVHTHEDVKGNWEENSAAVVQQRVRYNKSVEVSKA